MPLDIRPATRADAARICQVIEELADYERLRDACKASPEAIAEHLFGEQVFAHCLIAEFDGEAVGFALYFFNFSTFLAKPGIYLEDLFVRPSVRGKGIGKALLQALAERAVAKGCGRMEWSVLNWNASAIAFYQSLGAKPQDEWSVYRLTGAPLATLAAARRPPPNPPTV